ncbi:hypothetical protein EJB05_23821, partial [Eragrostis curvula]
MWMSTMKCQQMQYDIYILLGARVKRPVILPPLEAGGIRCSVRPASRNARHSRGRDVKAFAKAPGSPLLNLERAGRRMHPMSQTQTPLMTSSPP